MSDRVAFTCNGEAVTVEVTAGESLLSVLRERLGITSAKDGCAPQGQCGCCTVLVDGEARVACVTPVARVAGRMVTTVEGLPAEERHALADAFVATGGSQCGFCTPGILMRAAAARARGKVGKADLDRALAAHLCRCTGWQTIYEALTPPPPRSGHAESRIPRTSVPRTRDLDAAGRRAELEGGVAQRVGRAVPLGEGGFADDTAPRDTLVAVPLPPSSAAPSVEAAGLRWVVAESLLEARALAGKVQGRRTTVADVPPLPLPPLPDGGVRLATSWVEPAYLEPDASWCEPGGEPASPLANGGAFGGKASSPVTAAARELADRYGRAVRVLFSREDVVRLGPKRPPFAASAVLREGRPHPGETSTSFVIEIAGEFFGEPWLWPLERLARIPWCRGVGLSPRLLPARATGPITSLEARGAGHAEVHVLVEGALDEAGFDRAAHSVDDRSARVLLDNVVSAPGSRSLAGARVHINAATGALELVQVRVAAGDPLDEVVLRSYAIGAAHMALGWVLTEGLAVDPETGEVQDLTIRSFGVLRPKATPPIEVTILDDPGPPLARASDAVFAAVAAATWNALARAEGTRPETFPARETRAARMLRR